MLKVSFPQTYEAERTWIVKVLLNTFLGVEYTIEAVNQNCFLIEAMDNELVLPDIFFAQPKEQWLTPESLPIIPLEKMDTTKLGWNIPLLDPIVPVIFGNNKNDIKPGRIVLELDIFGSAFFMLSRYEEIVKRKRDHFDRFSAFSSLAHQESFLDRPIVNEYLEILWKAIKQLWPQLKRKKRKAQTYVSCDVDVPYSPGTKSISRLVRQMGGDLIKRKNYLQCIQTGFNFFGAQLGHYGLDPYYRKFRWMMDANEQAGNVVAFYFLTDHTSSEFDGCYAINEPIMHGLISAISDRGHEIGLHSSYHTYKNKEQTCREADKMRAVMQEHGLDHSTMGGRQHFLRWSNPESARNFEAADLTYDTTLGFPEFAGFRCGVCYEYPLFDLIQRRELNLIERPLTVMEKSVFDKNYMGYEYDIDGLQVFEQLKQNCHTFNGDFTILWHNHQFPKRQAEEIYQTIIQ